MNHIGQAARQLTKPTLTDYEIGQTFVFRSLNGIIAAAFDRQTYIILIMH